MNRKIVCGLAVLLSITALILGSIGCKDGTDGSKDETSDTSSNTEHKSDVDAGTDGANPIGGTDTEVTAETDSGETDENDTENTEVPKSICEQYIQAHNDCGVFTAGKVSCSLVDDYTECEMACLLESSCPTLTAYYCEAFYLYCFADCDPKVFICTDGEEIPASQECDLKTDCADGSDEHEGCKIFTCASGDEVIRSDYECDFKSDCSDGSDEYVGCAVFTCASGDEVINPAYECDFKPDCADGSDEHEDCASLTCG